MGPVEESPIGADQLEIDELPAVAERKAIEPRVGRVDDAKR
jgi:hypothetical protein